MRTVGPLIFNAAFFFLALPAFLNAETIWVTNSAANGTGSLRHAVEVLAHDGDEIRFDMSKVVSPISLNHEVEVEKSVSIYGPTETRLVINGGANSRVFYIEPKAKVTLYNLTISGGNGCNCDLSGNTQGTDNSLSKWDGGGINNKGDLTLVACTVSGNATTENHGGNGGAISNALGAKLTIINSTISGNSTKDGGKGGAIYNIGSLFVTNSTISNNSAPSQTGGIHNEGFLKIANSILAGNLKGPIADDLFSSGTIESNGFNFIGVGSTGNASDKSYASGQTIEDIIEPLGNNGGPTFTHALAFASPAINSGKNEDAIDQFAIALTTDQRGEPFKRIAESTVDIGAFESKAYMVTVDCNTTSNLGTDLQGAIQNANHFATIQLTEGCVDRVAELTSPIKIPGGATYEISGVQVPDEGSARIDLASSSQFLSSTARMTTLSAQNLSRVFLVEDNASLTVSNIRIANGFSSDNAAAVLNNGLLRLNRVIFSDNRVLASQDAIRVGGAAVLNAGSMDIRSAAFVNNSVVIDQNRVVASEDALRVGGAAILNEGSMNIRDASFLNNEVRSSYANSILAGGAVYHLRGSMNLTNVSFARNNLRVDANAQAQDIARAQGAALYAASALSMDGVYLEDNAAIARSESVRGAQALGGALYVQVSAQDAVRLRQISMSRNLASADALGSQLALGEHALAEGGAVYNAASSFALRMSDAQFVENQAIANNAMPERDAFARGAAVANYGILEADNNLLRRNEVRAVSQARSIAEAAAFYLAENSVARLNHAILTDNAARAQTNVVSSSQSVARGAAISAFGSLSLRAASFSHNSAIAESLVDASNSLRPSAQAFGAAMYVAPLSASALFDSTLDNNLVSASVRNLGEALAYGAAIANDGQLDLRQNTFYKNSAISQGQSALSRGGGLYNAVGGNLELRSSTLARNSAVAGANVFNAGQMLVQNSAFAYPALGANFSLAQTSAVSALSAYNFADDNSAQAFARYAADLLLNDLADNGGFSRTMLPKRESILVDAGSPNADCWQTYDARAFAFARCLGIPQPAPIYTGPIDVGAVELSECATNADCPLNKECQNKVCYEAAIDQSVCTTDKAFTYSRDQDGDGVGDNSDQVTACTPPTGYVVAASVSDNCPNVKNAAQTDSNSNGVGDACESTSGCKNDTTGNSTSSDTWILMALALLFFGIRFRRFFSASLIALLALGIPYASAQNYGKSQEVLALEQITQTPVVVNKATGAVSFAKLKKGEAKEAAPLSAEGAKMKAQGFLKSHGKAFGLSNPSDLAINSEKTDAIGTHHLTFKQLHNSVPVFGGELKIHFDKAGNIDVVNGNLIPNIGVSVTPTLNAQEAEAIAIKHVTSQKAVFALQAVSSELMVFRSGLARGIQGATYLTWKIEVSNSTNVREFVFVDAHSGKIVDQITGSYDALYREIYKGETNFKNGTSFWKEGETYPPAGAQTQDVAKSKNLMDFSKSFYDFFNQTFARDSYDGAGAAMISIFDREQGCPNASWNGTYVSVCDGLELDDVVAHEWAHALTEKTNGLVYQWEPGALNESYSDIWGEIVDLVNGTGKLGNENNNVRTQDTCSCQLNPDGKTSCDPDQPSRWLLAEDFGATPSPFRDLYEPKCFNDPDVLGGTNYQCDSSDFGGVHKNSSVPNRAFSLLVDGDGVANGIGLVKAAHIYYRAQTTYEGPLTNFSQHVAALDSACQDLIGQPLVDFDNSSPGVITAGDCRTVTNVSDQIFIAGGSCPTLPLLDPFNTPPIPCPRHVYFFNFKNDEQGFTTAQSFPGDISGLIDFEAIQKWQRVTQVPDNWQGAAFFAPNSRLGSANVNQDASNLISLISPPLSLPDPQVGQIILSFDHNIASEFGYDGGNLKYSIDNGKTWELFPNDAFIFNGYNSELFIDDPFTGEANSNPLKGEVAFTGSDNGEIGGSWVQSQVHLTPLRGKTILLRFDFGSDKASGVIGWYVTNIAIFNTDPTIEVATSCGEGFCAATGKETCNADTGRLQDSCIPNSPVTFFGDADGDGVPSPDRTLSQCVQPQGYQLATGIIDNCPTVANPAQSDANNNGVGDACEQAVETPKSSGCNAAGGSSQNGDWLVLLALTFSLLALGRKRRHIIPS